MQIYSFFFYNLLSLVVFLNPIMALSEAQQELAAEKSSLKSELSEAKTERNKELNKCLPIHDAALANDMPKLEILLKQHTSLDAIACFWEMTPIQYIIFKNETKKNPLLANTIQWFLKNGARDLEHKDNGFGRTALHLAAMYNQSDIINILCKYGANTKAQDDDGMTPLHLAAQYNNVDASKALIQNHVPLTVEKHDPDATKPENDPLSFPIHIAAYMGSIDILNLFINTYKQEIDVPDNKGETPLHYAAISLKMKPIKWLLDHGADVSIRDNGGKTALNQVAGMLLSIYNNYKDAQETRKEQPPFQTFLQDTLTHSQKKISKQIVEGMGLEYPEELIIKTKDDIRNHPVVTLLLAAKEAKEAEEAKKE